VEPIIIEYLKVPLTKVEINKLLKILGLQPRELMREKEKVYINMNLGDKEVTNDELISAMISEPILIERPIIIKDDKAVIGRPPEKVLNLLNS
jgi:arsenate reductase